jgi:hypothetical protein
MLLKKICKEINIKGIKLMELEMDMEDYSMFKDAFIKDNGRKIK